MSETDNTDQTEIPDEYKHHCMLGKYEYAKVDKDTGTPIPGVLGMFMVTTPRLRAAFPAHLNVQEDPFPRLEEVTMEKGDVLLVTCFKAGTHLLFEIMKMLQQGSAQNVSVPMPHQWIDASPYDTIIANQKAPRVLKTHITPVRLPPNFRRPDTKVVLGIRNMKDDFVSAYNHLGAIMDARKERTPWAEYFKYLLYSKAAPFGNLFDAYEDIWDKCRNDPNILIVNYETLVRNKKETVKAIADHMELPYTDQLLDDITSATDFDTMKKAKFQDEARLRQRLGDAVSVYRKGKVGDWKNWFTVAQNEEFHRKFDEWNKDRQIPMIFE